MNKPTIYTATPADLSPPVQTDSFCVDLVLATDYQKLKDELKHLAAENVALKAAFNKPDAWLSCHSIPPTYQEPDRGGEYLAVHEQPGVKNDDGSDSWPVYAKPEIETPATDRIVAEAEARGVEKGIAHLEKKFSNIGVQIMNLQWLADSLREGADK